MYRWDRPRIEYLLRQGPTKVGHALVGANLSGLNLSWLVLAGLDLRNANLTGTDLRRCNLKGADIRGANLSRANLVSALLDNANLSKARLCGADLSGASLCNADLSYADLTGVDTNNHLTKARFQGANLDQTILRDACLVMADLSGIDLTRADTTGATLVHVSPFPEPTPPKRIEWSYGYSGEPRWHSAWPGVRRLDDAKFVRQDVSLGRASLSERRLNAPRSEKDILATRRWQAMSPEQRRQWATRRYEEVRKELEARGWDDGEPLDGEESLSPEELDLLDALQDEMYGLEVYFESRADARMAESLLARGADDEEDAYDGDLDTPSYVENDIERYDYEPQDTDSYNPFEEEPPEWEPQERYD